MAQRERLEPGYARLVTPVSPPLRLAAPTSVDASSREWLQSLRADDATGQEAIARLHALLRAVRFEVARRRSTLPHLRGNELEDIATEAADDALMSVLRRLDDLRGAARFATWAYSLPCSKLRNGVPIDVLADRLNRSRGALFKTLHDARRKLRNHLHEQGLEPDNWWEEK
jgi:DNA-directed RNA polymerase specialized sigma24 family protein